MTNQVIPQGWRLVPAKMTLDMSIAFAEAWYSKSRAIDDHEMQDAYAAMLAAAPSPVAQVTDEPLGWKICFTDRDGQYKTVLHGHNAVGDYRDIDPMASSIPLGPFTPPAADERANVGKVLPEWEQVSAKLECGETLTPLEVFVHYNEPDGDDADAWRDQLSAALASAPVVNPTLPLERALHGLISKICPGLDTGEILQDARWASAALSYIMANTPAADARDALAWGVIENARAAMDASFESGDESLSVSVPSHLAAALCLALDELDAIVAKQGEGETA
ncbi:hypothetical protein D0850_06920 [Bordetella avium]|uniref:hypothetical protein n=1 Tax=Bordetella avium TaxID=521 RepID=UPI000E68219E|nr:hypothetical protein [Bordetella avium]RIQ18777.1 hypothetical protein D0850_06920 [Bordetella avium]